MTTTTHTQTALLVAAVETLTAVIADAKKAGVAVPGIGAEVAPGIKLRDLKNFAKDFKAKQAEAAKPAADKAPAKAPRAAAKAQPTENVRKAKAAEKAPVAAELKSGEIREAGEISLWGRTKETVVRITKIGDARFVATASGLKIAVADLEKTSRGTIRVKSSEAAKYTHAGGQPLVPAKGAAKAPVKAVEQEDFPTEGATPSKAAEGRVFPVRKLKIKTSTQLTGAEYDRNTQTLFVTLKDNAVWAYEGLKLSDVKAFENAAQPWKHFSAHIANNKKGRMVKNHGLAKAQAQAKAESKPTAAPRAKTEKAPAVKAAAAAEPISTTALRAEGFVDGRKHETVQSIVRNKTTDERVVVTVSGKRIPLTAIVKVKGKFRVSDVALIEGGKKAPAKTAAAKPAENVRKPKAQAQAAKAPAAKMNGKAPRANFAEAGVKAKVASAPVTKDEIKALGVRVTKGAQSKVAKVLRIVRHDEGMVAVTESRVNLLLDCITGFDGQPTFVGKIQAAEFNAL